MNVLEMYGKIGGTTIFIVILVILYACLYASNPSVFSASLNNSLSLLVQLIPLVAAVYAFTFFINLIPVKPVMDLMKKDEHKWVIAIIGGILSSGPIYMWYPLLSELKAKGLDSKYIIAFLYNRSIKIPLLPLMISYFNLNYVLLLTGLTILFSTINGFVGGIMLRGDEK